MMWDEIYSDIVVNVKITNANNVRQRLEDARIPCERHERSLRAEFVQFERRRRTVLCKLHLLSILEFAC